LDTIPESLEATYKETLDNIPVKDRQVAREILMWLCSSLRPMTLQEIAEAVHLLQPGFALRVCTSMLVTLVHEDTDEVIKLAHFSIKEYLILQQEIENDSGFRFTDESAQATLADTTIKCLLETNKLITLAPISDMTLLHYSARFWYRHAIVVVENDRHSSLLELIDRLFSQEYSTSYHNWLRTYNCDDPYRMNVDKRYSQPLYYAALLGFYKSVRKLITEGAKVTQEGNVGNAFLAASNNGHEGIVIEMLERGYVPSTAEICRATRVVKYNAQKIMQIYLEKLKIDIIEEVVEAAAGNYESGKDVMTVLLNRKGEDIWITEEVVNAAAENYKSGKDVMTVLLDRRAEDIQVTEDAVAEIAMKFGGGVMARLLRRKGKDIRITEEVVEAAAENYTSGKDVMTVLLDRKREDIQITEKAVIGIARRFDGEVITLLLDRREEDIRITEELVKAAAENYGSGKNVMTVLLDRKREDIQITEKAVIEIVRRFDEEVITLLLDRKEEDIQITEELVKAAVINWRYGKEVLIVLRDRENEGFKSTEGAVIWLRKGLRWALK
jgi:hypothetical protein